MYQVMTNILDSKGMVKRVVNLISNPITEMVCAFIIDFSRNYIIGFLQPFAGDHLHFLMILFLIVVPWIMLGHGAIRYTQNTDKAFTDLSNNNLSSVQIQKRNPKLLGFLLTAFVITKLFTF